MNWESSTVMITGGTGSFGQRCVQALLEEYHPKKVIIFSRDELKQSEMRRKFTDTPPSKVRYLIGDVRDRERLTRAMKGVDIVIHAAAQKQVPSCEYNPAEAIKTNISGSMNIIDAALDNAVKKCILVSTDKAVNPINLYGATKLCAEKLFVAANVYDSTRFSCTRYGNVWGSRGSFAEVLADCILKGIAIPVTDPAMTRFIIELHEGVDFVLGCVEDMEGGEIFVPKLPSYRIMELLDKMARGHTVSIIGVRPGEKIHEVLISADEARHAVELPEKYIILPENIYFENKKWLTYPRLRDGFSYTSEQKQ